MSVGEIIGSYMQDSLQIVRDWSEDHPNVSHALQNVAIATSLFALYSFAARMDRKLNETRRLEDIRFSQLEAGALEPQEGATVRSSITRVRSRTHSGRRARNVIILRTIPENGSEA